MRQKGFTIIEVLTVVVVIGILAGIVLISYGTVQKQAQDAAVKSDLEGIAGQLEGHRTRSTPKEYPHDAATLATLSIKASKDAYKTTTALNFVYCVDTSDYQSYALVAESNTGAIFKMTQDGLQSNTLTESNFTASLCSGMGMTLVSNGMSSPNTWQSWVGS